MIKSGGKIMSMANGAALAEPTRSSRIAAGSVRGEPLPFLVPMHPQAAVEDGTRDKC